MEYNMVTLYKGCLFFGIAFSILTLLAGDFFDDALDGIFDAVFPGDMDGSFSLIVTFLSVFGGIGLLFEYNTSFNNELVIIFSLLLGIGITSAFYFLYLKPMKESENSVAFSLSELVGKTGELTVPVSGNKYGEIVVKIGAGYTSNIASSSSGEDIPAGTTVLVDEIKEGILYVSKINCNVEVV